jgi:hypothetical protein
MDTSEPGGLYKDQVYLEGSIGILKERHTLDFHALCCGKISIQIMKQLAEAKKLKKDCIKIPPFMRNLEEYLRALDRIAKVNFIDEHLAEIEAKVTTQDGEQAEAVSDDDLE